MDLGFHSGASSVISSHPRRLHRAADFPGPEFTREHLRGLAPAGRLDIDSKGLIVFTQDGRLAKQLTGENSEIEKEYLVRVDGGLDDDGLALLRHGLSLDADCCSYLAGPNAAAKQLSPTELNEADANSDGPMTLRVQVKNSGDFPESDLTVTVQIDDKEFTQKITALDKGQEETVDIEFTIDDIDVSLETSITVTAEPVENEFNKQNNQQKFRVQFQLA